MMVIFWAVALFAIAALSQRVLLPLRWLPAVASSLAHHQRFAYGRLPLRSLTQLMHANAILSQGVIFRQHIVPIERLMFNSLIP